MTAPTVFTPLPKAEQESRAIEREAEADRTNLATLASARGRVRSTLQWGRERRLSDAEARHYAFAAMAALNHEVIDRGFDGKPRTVGPYVNNAVLHVLRDVEHSASDLHVVEAMACAINVALRVTV